MKSIKMIIVVFLLATGFTAWAGTTRVVLQNDLEGGYQGCSDTWINKDVTSPTGERAQLYILYELCSS